MDKWIILRNIELCCTLVEVQGVTQVILCRAFFLTLVGVVKDGFNVETTLYLILSRFEYIIYVPFPK